MVFIRQKYLLNVKNVEKSAENTGFLHVFPNKGGLCISLTIFGTILSFISCHLTAHEGVKKCHMRNESVEEILGGIRSTDKKIDPSLISHHTFWMGDMNYRTTFDKRTPADLDPKEKADMNQKVKLESPITDPSLLEDEEDQELDLIPGRLEWMLNEHYLNIYILILQ
jgi:hypothetical protein